MGEFKKGDFVRRVKPSYWPTQYGVIDGVYEVLEERQCGIVVIPGGSDAEPSSFEPWQPRVGERVRVTGNDQWVGDGDVTTVADYGVFILLMKTGQFAGKEGGFYLRDLEPILTTTATPEQRATLKIEAGKFYKTRDGRKVGPMRDDWGSEDVFHYHTTENILTGCLWDKTGKGYSGQESDKDLIAEWIDEPVVATNDNAQQKFKAGDRVKSVENGPTKGHLGVILENDESEAPFRVAFDDWTGGHGVGDSEWWLLERDIVQEPSSTTIVALIENGQPKPSSTPHVHASTGAAEKEAKRLAAKFKGQQFGVFTLTTTHHEPKPVYDHKWQNMAAMGLKIDAIRELRAVAGLTLKGAKDAVEAWINYQDAA